MQPEPFSSGADPFNDAVADEAAAWLARRDRGMTLSERGEFGRWMEVPANAAEFARIEGVWRDLDQVGGDPGLAEMARELDEATRPHLSRRVAGYGLVAAAAAAAIILVLTWQRPSRTGTPAQGTRPKPSPTGSCPARPTR